MSLISISRIFDGLFSKIKPSPSVYGPTQQPPIQSSKQNHRAFSKNERSVGPTTTRVLVQSLSSDSR